MDLLQKLNEHLATSLAAAPDLEGQPLTVGDLYQRLIPYRLIRTELDVMELAAYEHLLLRLLGGEGGYIELGSSAAREEIKRELASNNPILGIYRDYAEVAVTVQGSNGTAPASFRIVDEDANSGAVFRKGLTSLPTSAPAASNAFGVAEPADEVAERIPRLRLSIEGGKSGPEKCTSCEEQLPAIAGLRFCPFCGEARRPQCPRCSTVLEASWNFCIRCGTQVEQPAFD